MYEVVTPRGRRAASQSSRFAKRLDTLQGKTVGFLWNGLFRGEAIFPVLEQELAQRYPGLKLVGYQEFGIFHGREEAQVLAALPNKLTAQGCDAVIAAVGC